MLRNMMGDSVNLLINRVPSEPESDSTSTTSSQSSWNTIPDISTPDRDQTDLTQIFMASRTDP